ncbi:MAG: hypothetical protein AB1458_15605 [Bacteroidota bacterium]
MSTRHTAAALLLLLAACSGPRYFTSPDFAQKTANHKLVAILPVQMIMTGKKPEKLTDEDIAKIEEGESRAFQMSLYNNILKNHTTKKGTIMVELQPYEKTMQIFKEKGIDLRKSWEADPMDLCKVLGVDAVVKTRVQKTRYMSDLASYGIDLGYHILSQISIPATVIISGVVGPAKTNDIDAQCSLFNGADGSLLWKDMYKASASWNAPANDVIEGMTHTFAYHFPYRKKAPK